jgi:hypothetical protein
MTILLDPLAVDASRSTPRDEEAPVPQLWASSARIVEVEFRMHCNCFVCNLHKGPNIAGIDPITSQLTRLFHPRLDDWDSHFTWNGALLVGRTPVGRTTIVVLAINDPDYVALRAELMEDGTFAV